MNLPTAPLAERWTIVDGLPLFSRLATDAAPAGAVPLVHVHGFGISGRYLVPTAERLAPYYPTYVPDLPGYGRSSKPKRTLSIPELADALAAYLDAVGVEKAVLLGNSLGAVVTADFAHRYPDRIERAILVSPAGGPHNQPILRGLGQLMLDSVREPLGLYVCAVPDYLRFGLLNFLRLFRAMTQYRVVEQFASLTLPVLVVVGGRDPLVAKRRIRQALEQEVNLTLVSLTGAAHAINYSHPARLASVVHAYLQDRPIEEEADQQGEVVVVGRTELAERAGDQAAPSGSEAPP